MYLRFYVRGQNCLFLKVNRFYFAARMEFGEEALFIKNRFDLCIYVFI